MNSLKDEISRLFNHPSMVMKLILINVLVYLMYQVPLVFISLSGNAAAGLWFQSKAIDWLTLPAHLPTLLTRFWTLFTHLFFHEGLWHLLGNMIWLYWFGQILQEFLGNKKVLPIYLLGGFVGAILYIISFNIFPGLMGGVTAARAFGASAGVMAIVVAAATIVPDYTIMLILIGPVKLKYIAIFTLLIDFIGIPAGNPGGHIAHLGGALMGFIFIRQLQNGNDFSRPFTFFFEKINSLFTKQEKPRGAFRKFNEAEPVMKPKPGNGIDKQAEQKKIDAILDKISKSGYDSLTTAEKDFLFSISNNDKK